MHQAGAVLGADVVGGQHPKGVGRIHEVRERRQIAHTEQLGARVGGQHLGFVPQFAGVRRHPRLGQQVAPPVGAAHLDIGDVRIDGHSLVRRQRPRRRRPDEQVCARDDTLGHLESHGQRGILTALVDVVVHPQLVAGQGGLVVPAVRQHAVALVGQALVPQPFEGPDHRFHETGIERLVVIVEVDPPGLASDVGPPFLGVLQHRCAAGLVELVDAQLFDLALLGDAELALHLEFGGQAVRVPAEPPLHLVAAHGAVARHDVLDVAGEQVSVVRETVGERRAVVEHVLRRVVTPVDAGAEGAVGVPVVQHLGLELREVRRSGGRLRIGSHCVSSPVPNVAGARKPSFVQARGRRRACARAPRYHPACAPKCAARCQGVDGPNRSVLLGPVGESGGPFFRRLPGDGRIGACASILGVRGFPRLMRHRQLGGGKRGRRGLRGQLDERERELLGELLDGVRLEAARVVPPVEDDDAADGGVRATRVRVPAAPARASPYANRMSDSGCACGSSGTPCTMRRRDTAE